MKRASLLFSLLGLFILVGCDNQTKEQAVSPTVETPVAVVEEPKKSEKELIDEYFKDKELLYEKMLDDVLWNANIEVNITDDEYHDKAIKVYCNDCKCLNYSERLNPLMVMMISEQIDTIIGRPGYINVEFIDNRMCDRSGVKSGCGGDKTHAECY